MYTVILVDDEPSALSGLQNLINWNEYGFHVIDALTDPRVAIRKLVQEKPNVVFVDILMPNINGIDLIREVTESGIKTKFVIISAYSDFEYAQQAIKYKVYNYCLKPLKKVEIISTLKNLGNELEAELGNNNQPEHYFPDNIEVEHAIFKDLLRYIHKNYKQKLYLNKLAEKFYLNANYCGFLFKKYFDCSFADYVTKIRMEASMQYLQDKFLSIYEVAELVGYDDYFYFNKVFKKYYGITPNKYRTGI